MTTEGDEVRQDGSELRPFLLRFAETLPDTQGDQIRYDQTRQRSEVFLAGQWVDSTSARATSQGTRVTKVHQETTDDS